MNEEVKKEEVKVEETTEVVEENSQQTEEKTVKTKKEEKKEKKDKFTKQLEAKEKEIEEIKNQLEIFKDKYYRTLADMDNQRKQYEKDYRQALKYASASLAEQLIPSFEMFSMVIESSDNLPPEVLAYVQGFSMIYRQMVSALEAEGITEIKVKVGDEFDHTVHAAMETQEVEDEALVNKITKVIRKGYKIHDRLIKPATVIVGKAKVKEEVNNEENENKQANA